MIIKSIGIGLIIALAFAGLPLLDTSSSPLEESVVDALAEPNHLLLMMYMSADVAGSPLNWTEDLNEAEYGLLSEDLTVIALVDPPGTGDSKLFQVMRDAANSNILVSQEISDPGFFPADNETEMGNSNTLVEFAKYCTDNFYDGGRIGLIIWGHGSGWIGVALDKGDYLEIPELEDALQQINEHINGMIDLLLFDACSMSSLECMSSFSGLASYAVASELDVPVTGYPYDTILARISSDMSQSTSEIAFAFADEYVKFGALVLDITSQAAVIDLEKMRDLISTFREFSTNCTFFNPIEHESFAHTRNSSLEIETTASVDVINFIEELEASPSSPRRLIRTAIDTASHISDVIVNNRVYVAEIDAEEYDSISIHGISIYFPKIQVILDEYRSVSTLAYSWANFLDEFYTNDSYLQPEADLTLFTIDLKYSDGLNDSFSFSWIETTEIENWEFDVFMSGNIGFLISESEEDSNETHVINTVETGYYNLFTYGRDSDGKYRFYQQFTDMIIYRMISFILEIPNSIDYSNTELKIINLRTNEISSLQIEKRSNIIKLTIPEPNKLGDRLLFQLYRGDSLLASGLLDLDGSAAEIQIFEKPAPSNFTFFMIFVVISLLIIFATIRLLRIGGKGR